MKAPGALVLPKAVLGNHLDYIYLALVFRPCRKVWYLVLGTLMAMRHYLICHLVNLNVHFTAWYLLCMPFSPFSPLPGLRRDGKWPVLNGRELDGTGSEWS